MLTKLLITILVIVGAMTYLRNGRNKQQQAKTNYDLANDNRFSGAKLSIYALIVLSLSATVAYWGWGWYQDNIVVNVTITSPLKDKTQTYQVRKKDIEMQRITTVDGVQIRLSNQERITITPLVETDKQ